MNISGALSYRVENNNKSPKGQKQKQLIVPKEIDTYIVVISCSVPFNLKRN